MAVTYTQVTAASFTAAGSGAWEDYDMNGNQGVPVGAICEVVACQGENGSANVMGVRGGASALARTLRLHEGEGGDMVPCMFLAEVDSNGDIAIYTEDHLETSFVLMGYWQGVTFTEMWESITIVLAEEEAWTEKTLAGGAASRVHFFALVTDTWGSARTCGVRATDSARARTIDMHEAESAGVDPTTPKPRVSALAGR